MTRDDPIQSRGDYAYFTTITTRWMDNDLYGHINNVVYYSFFDTVINGYLIREGDFDIARAQTIGLAVESSCRYRRAIAYPQTVHAGLRVAHLGKSSVALRGRNLRRRRAASLRGRVFRARIRRSREQPIDADPGAHTRRACAHQCESSSDLSL